MGQLVSQWKLLFPPNYDWYFFFPPSALQTSYTCGQPKYNKDVKRRELVKENRSEIVVLAGYKFHIIRVYDNLVLTQVI